MAKLYREGTNFKMKWDDDARGYELEFEGCEQSHMEFVALSYAEARELYDFLTVCFDAGEEWHECSSP